MNHIKSARIVGRTGFSTRDVITFEAISTEILSASEIIEIQTELGYHPAGYGFGNVKFEGLPGVTIKTTWSCQGSCD